MKPSCNNTTIFPHYLRKTVRIPALRGLSTSTLGIFFSPTAPSGVIYKSNTFPPKILLQVASERLIKVNFHHVLQINHEPQEISIMVYQKSVLGCNVYFG